MKTNPVPLLPLLAALALLTAPVGAEPLSGQGATAVERVPFDPAKWTLAWADEFDRDGAPDPAAWAPETGYIRNHAAQYYTAGRPENARVEHGVLVIEARRDNWDGKPITSASLNTGGKRSFLYGRIAVRAKLPTGRGTWPAIWMMGEGAAGEQLRWPDRGEIDLMENVGFDPQKIHANIHCAAYNHTKGNGRGNAIKPEEFGLASPWTEFHEYAVEWYEDRLEFFCDDLRYFVYRKEADDPAVWPFSRPHYLLINLAIGGAWGGLQGIDETLFPHRYEIDYVRYYQPKP
jgi:beta-glucanase (GH16 family)